MFANFARIVLALSLLGILSATLEVLEKKHDEDPRLRKTVAVALQRILPKAGKKKAARLRGKIVDAGTDVIVSLSSINGQNPAAW